MEATCRSDLVPPTSRGGRLLLLMIVIPQPYLEGIGEEAVGMGV